MEWLLRRNFWMVKLVGALFVAAFLANTVTTIGALWLFTAPSVSAADGDETSDEGDPDDAAADAAALASATKPKPQAWRDPEKIGARILGRNVFCPECEPEVANAAPVNETPTGTPSFDGARRTALPLELAATMESDDPGLSLATIKHVEGGYAGLYAAGDELARGVRIVAIAGGRVDLLNQGQPEYLEFGPPPKAPATLRPSTPARKTTDQGKAVVADAALPGADEAIKCDGAGCQVERDFVESLIAKPQLLVGQGSARAAKTASGEDGFRLGGVKKGSLPDLLGLETGDIITEVGGQPLTYDSLMALYPKLRNAKHIEVTVDRKGERISKALEIVS